MNSSEPFGSHCINHLLPCAESCPIRMTSFGSLGRAGKPVGLLGTEAEGQVAQRGAPAQQEQPTPVPYPLPAIPTLHPPLHLASPNKTEPQSLRPLASVRLSGMFPVNTPFHRCFAQTPQRWILQLAIKRTLANTLTLFLILSGGRHVTPHLQIRKVSFSERR